MRVGIQLQVRVRQYLSIHGKQSSFIWCSNAVRAPSTKCEVRFRYRLVFVFTSYTDIILLSIGRLVRGWFLTQLNFMGTQTPSATSSTGTFAYHHQPCRERQQARKPTSAYTHTRHPPSRCTFHLSPRLPTVYRSVGRDSQFVDSSWRWSWSLFKQIRKHTYIMDTGMV